MGLSFHSYRVVYSLYLRRYFSDTIYLRIFSESSTHINSKPIHKHSAELTYPVVKYFKVPKINVTKISYYYTNMYVLNASKYFSCENPIPGHSARRVTCSVQSSASNSKYYCDVNFRFT